MGLKISCKIVQKNPMFFTPLTISIFQSNVFHLSKQGISLLPLFFDPYFLGYFILCVYWDFFSSLSLSEFFFILSQFFFFFCSLLSQNFFFFFFESHSFFFSLKFFFPFSIFFFLNRTQFFFSSLNFFSSFIRKSPI
jgi:hypothetical protein